MFRQWTLGQRRPLQGNLNRDASEVLRFKARRTPMFELTDIDSSGTGSCSASHEGKIEDAVDFILRNLSDIRTSCTSNTAFGLRRTCFSNHSHDGDTSPRTLVEDTLEDEDIDFVIHCTAAMWCIGTVAYTWNGQWNDRQQDIWICEDFLTDTDTSDSSELERLACVIVHEIMHVWGADENAADSMEPSSWDCFA